MKYPTISIQGSILLSDILDKIAVESEFKGQKPTDFGLPKKGSVKDEINIAWSTANALWKSFVRQKEKIKKDETGTTLTRNSFVLPLLSQLGYNLEINRADIVNDKSYAISHRDNVLKGFPVHIMGFNDSLDQKRSSGGPRMSPHALMQEYLNVTEHLYGIITNGNQLRLLRDSTRLIKLSYLEFDLQQMFEEEHFADFALLFRLLHATRMPKDIDSAAESLIETYHLDSLESGTRIRNGLSEAVEKALKILADGFLSNSANTELLQQINKEEVTGEQFYKDLLDLVYKLLFLLVIEERNLIFPDGTDKQLVDIYYDYYSVSALRKKADRNFIEEQPYYDLWMGLLNTFAIFHSTEKSHKMNIEPLGGDIFEQQANDLFSRANISNSYLLEALRKLSFFFDAATNQRIRVNYGGLNVEEFGSVYEGLLEYTGSFNFEQSPISFTLIRGSGRSSSGSHYTPDDLVKPLIDNSLEHIIEDKLKLPNPEQELLSITVCDVACGSGHILLNAARRIAYELAKVRSNEAQPTPEVIRVAIRDVISTCIYGVDLNPMAVKLCKIALWLEAHNPGKPLRFLDNKIKCGNAIVGLALSKELNDGIANEAFKRLEEDDKDVCKELRDRNRREKKEHSPTQITLFNQLDNIIAQFAQLNQMPETTPDQIKQKQEQYSKIINTPEWLDLKNLADIQTAQFFIPKTLEFADKLITDSQYREYYHGRQMLGQAVGEALAIAANKKFFHWFLEFPEIFANSGFDVILGNPPFLGGQQITGTYGNDFANYLRYKYAPIKSVDLVTYFFRRIYTLIKPNAFQALISTNTIAQGSAREGGLAVIIEQGGSINFAFRNKKWPGLAAVAVSLLSIYKGEWQKRFILDNKEVKQISSYLDDTLFLGEPFQLAQNKDKSFQGSIVLGDGFVLTPEQAKELIRRNHDNKQVLFPYMNGRDLNNTIDQSPTRWVINFFDWPLRRMTNEEWSSLSDREQSEIQSNIANSKNIVLAPPDYPQPVAQDFPVCLEIVKRDVKLERENQNDVIGKKFWWQFLRMRSNLYQTIAPLERIMIINRHSKIPFFPMISSNYIYSEATVVIADDSWYIYACLNSSINIEWAWKNGSTLGSSGLRYSPTDCFQTFPFPQSLSPEMEAKLEQIGEKYYQHRQALMQNLQLGLTKTYNQFHNKHVNEELLVNSLEVESDYHVLNRKAYQKKHGKGVYELVHHLIPNEKACDLQTAITGIIELRRLHKEMDEVVLTAYGWSAESGCQDPIDLEHDFYEVDYLPENDRVRYTISPDARKEVLERLLLLNHKIYQQEQKESLGFNETVLEYSEPTKRGKRNKDEIEVEWEDL